jgi:hypothetical protein
MIRAIGFSRLCKTKTTDLKLKVFSCVSYAADKSHHPDALLAAHQNGLGRDRVLPATALKLNDGRANFVGDINERVGKAARIRFAKA